ncbi:BC1872 family protein [Parageobacillus thermoglucosidasius]|uniref:BC1872 family protein n=1 Tax=Parageobacillus thermoglucosidasius TaxID=1426 RepID=UPI000B563460|nr:hypothetical protein [Parageobacillus thermoglucosidasius]MBY6267998.1 hypothetical protein [Parageobacillus thermoglucosidasius]OUM84915.1 MAG: hypothetical protein BAA00_02330 [Parageobacillus thermoglucosidasius]
MDLRAIDCLIAEKVMGWRLENRRVNIWGQEIGFWVNPKINRIVAKYSGFREESFSPSTNIADAWQVVEKLKIAVIPQAGEPPKNMKYLAEIDRRPLGGYYQAFAKTAPLAICLVALKAVGVEVEVNEQ